MPTGSRRKDIMEALAARLRQKVDVEKKQTAGSEDGRRADEEAKRKADVVDAERRAALEKEVLRRRRPRPGPPTPGKGRRNDTILVDRMLRGVNLVDVLDARAGLTAHDRTVTAPDGREELPVLQSSATLQPGMLYPARHNKQLGFYAPAYRVADDSGSPAVKLTFLGSEPEVGRLDITLAWTAPTAGTDDVTEVRVMDHVASLELVHRVLVHGSDGQITGSVTETVPLQPAVVSGSGVATSSTIFADRATFQAVYTAMRNVDAGPELVVGISARVVVQSWRQVHLHRPEIADLQHHLLDSNVMITNILGRRDVVKATTILQKTPVKFKLAAPKPAANVTSVRRRSAAAGAVALPGRLTRAKRRASASVTRPTFLTSLVGVNRMRDLTITGLLPGGRSAVADVAPPDTNAEPVHLVSSVMAASLLQGQLRAEFIPSLKDAVVDSGMVVKSRPAIPVRVAVDREGKPALVEVEVAGEQRMPFVYPPQESPGVYSGAAEADGAAAIRFLVQRQIHREGKPTITVLQDNVLKDVIHLPPTQFRLGRDRTSPYLPRLSFVLSEVATTDDDVDAEVLFRAAVVYELEPWTDPEIVEAVRVDLAPSGIVPTFTVIAPRSVRFLLDGEERADAEVDPLIGIRDILDLDAGGFAELTGRHLAGSGLGGEVTFDLFDGSEARAEVRLSFTEVAHDLVDVLFTGRDSGQCIVSMRNRIESPITIVALPEVRVTAAGRAAPVNGSTVIGRRLAPMEAVEVRYQLEDPAVVLTDFAPPVLAQPHPDVQRLCAQLIEGPPGYDSMAFAVPVAAADGVFAATDDPATQLTGLLVEFDDDSRVTLTPDAPEVEVSLIGRLLDQVFAPDGDDREERYFYRVTNLHLAGEGARSAWQEAKGTSPLTVGVALGDLTGLPF